MRAYWFGEPVAEVTHFWTDDNALGLMVRFRLHGETRLRWATADMLQVAP